MSMDRLDNKDKNIDSSNKTKDELDSLRNSIEQKKTPKSAENLVKNPDEDPYHDIVWELEWLQSSVVEHHEQSDEIHNFTDEINDLEHSITWKNSQIDNPERDSTKSENETQWRYENYWKNLLDRDPVVRENILQSAENLENFISKWKEESNPIARLWLRIINWIMKSEK